MYVQQFQPLLTSLFQPNQLGYCHCFLQPSHHRLLNKLRTAWNRPGTDPRALFNSQLVDSIDPSLPHSLPPPPPLILVVNIAHPKASKPAASCFPSKATLQLDQPPALSPVDSLRRDITRTFSLIDGLRDYVQAFTYLVYDQRPHTPLQLADFDY